MGRSPMFRSGSNIATCCDRGAVGARRRTSTNAAFIVLAVSLLLAGASAAHAQSLGDRIARGEAFQVTFTGPQCPNDAGWTGSTDPMGTIQCGQTYRVTYRSGAWSVTGFNEGTRAVGTWTYSGLDPRSSQLNIWGRGYQFTNDGRVLDRQYGFVGYVRMANAPAQSQKPAATPTPRPQQPSTSQPRPANDPCRGIRGTPRPSLSAGSKALQDWLRCNRIGG